MDDLNLAKLIGRALKSQKLMLATAESCTGGFIAQIVTAVSGSTEWFERGFVTYSNASKQEMLGVREETLQKYGAVSIQTAQEMAEGALLRSRAQVSIAVTGIAGPTGGTPEKPVGTVCFAWARVNTTTKTARLYFAGSRNAVRAQAALYALQKLLVYLKRPI